MTSKSVESFHVLEQSTTQTAEVAVLGVIDLGDTPGVLATLDGAAVWGLDIFGGSNDGEGHGFRENTGMLGASFIIGLDRRSIDSNSLSSNDFSYLKNG